MLWAQSQPCKTLLCLDRHAVGIAGKQLSLTLAHFLFYYPIHPQTSKGTQDENRWIQYAIIPLYNASKKLY